MKMYKILLVGLITVLIIACNKYPEGPVLSLRTKRARLAGKWKVADYKVNNVDQLYMLQPDKIEVSKSWGINFYYNTRDKFAEVKNESTQEREGFVGFVNEGDYLCFLPEKSMLKNFRYIISVINNDTTQTCVYQVVKLTKKEVKLLSIDYAEEQKEITLKR